MDDYRYDNQTVNGFILSAIFWGVIGIVAGLWISVQMWLPSWNVPPYFTFGRLRVFHTNVLAVGLGIGAIFGITYYIVMRLTRIPSTASDPSTVSISAEGRRMMSRVSAAE